MEEREYYKQLVEEYAIGFFPDDESILDWSARERKQRDYLNDRYGEAAWDIHRFMELCRAEKISESFFRQLVRYRMDKCFKNLNNEK